MSSDQGIAEAGLDLATANDARACCELLHAWAIRIAGAKDARITYESAAGLVQIGTGGDGGSLAWERFDLDSGSGELSLWSAQLEILRPGVDGWQQLMEMLSRQATLGFRRVAERAVLARHERQQRALVEAGMALSGERTLEGVLKRIVEHAMELTDAQYGALGVLDSERESLASFITVGIDEATQARIGDLPRGLGILGALIDDPRPLRLARLQSDPRSVGFPEHHPPMESFLGVPIVTARSVAGRIYLTQKQGAPEFSLEDQELVETLASQASIAIDNAALNDQLQQTAAQLEEVSQHKSAFLANMSHELRSPLNTITGYTKLLLEDRDKLDQEQIEDLEIVRDSSEHLLALITDLLDLQRIEAGRISLAFSDENLAEIVETVVASVRPSVREEVVLVADLAGLHNPSVRCDRTRVRQILLNILGNAIKFTQTGTIEVVVRDDGPDVLVEVRDTGPGIPDSDQARIFDTFYQSNAALSRTPGPHEGAGLGLAITRMLTELHRGSVALQSKVGVGTTITIHLPRSAMSQEGSPEHA